MSNVYNITDGKKISDDVLECETLIQNISLDLKNIIYIVGHESGHVQKGFYGMDTKDVIYELEKFKLQLLSEEV